MPSTRRPSASTARKRLAAPERDARIRWRPSRTTRLRTVVGARSRPALNALKQVGATTYASPAMLCSQPPAALTGTEPSRSLARTQLIYSQPAPSPPIAGGRTLIVHDPALDEDSAGRGPRVGAYRHIARFGANPPETVEGLRTETGCDALAACGLSAVLFNQSADGTSRREAYRQALHIGIRPVVRLMTAEFRAKLDAPGLEIDRSDLHTAGRVRSFKQLVEAGVDPVDAAEVTGITPDTTDSRPAAERAAGAGR